MNETQLCRALRCPASSGIIAVINKLHTNLLESADRLLQNNVRNEIAAYILIEFNSESSGFKETKKQLWLFWLLCCQNANLYHNLRGLICL